MATTNPNALVERITLHRDISRRFFHCCEKDAVAICLSGVFRLGSVFGFCFGFFGVKVIFILGTWNVLVLFHTLINSAAKQDNKKRLSNARLRQTLNLLPLCSVNRRLILQNGYEALASGSMIISRMHQIQ
jgi:hypothetical protein